MGTVKSFQRHLSAPQIRCHLLVRESLAELDELIGEAFRPSAHSWRCCRPFPASARESPRSSSPRPAETSRSRPPRTWRPGPGWHLECMNPPGGARLSGWAGQQVAHRNARRGGRVGRPLQVNHLSAQHARLTARRGRFRAQIASPTRSWSRPTTCSAGTSPTATPARTGYADATTTPAGWSASWNHSGTPRSWIRWPDRGVTLG